MARLFGFSIEENEDKSKSVISPVPPTNEDGADFYVSTAFGSQTIDFEGVYRSEYELIRRYREMALHPECDQAIENVINEAIVSDLDDSPVEIDLSNLNASDGIKDKIREVRAPLLEAEDVVYMKALEADDASAKTASVTKKTNLRNAPAAQAITDATTIAELKAAWDTSLLGTSPYA